MLRQQEGHVKDKILNELAERGNVAQFVSFGPDLSQRFSRVRGYEPNHRFESVEAAVGELLAVSPESSVNVRSFEPHNPKSRAFKYGLEDPERVVTEVRALAEAGLTTIINETVNVGDGGVSGVAFEDTLEFAPEHTPRCVEDPKVVVASLPRELGLRLLHTVYGFEPDLSNQPGLRIEWSLHPLPRGFHHAHTILWEVERQPTSGTSHSVRELVRWPNHFSRFLGDKAYGLLMGHLLGLPVPRTQVIARKVAPFNFGQDTGVTERWIRTCPTEQLPGLFTTQHGWLDPFELMSKEDPEGTAIASILCQQGVQARYSGSLVAQADAKPHLEGASGFGEDFMGGRRGPETLPEEVTRAVLGLYEHVSSILGPVRFEWVWDGANVWLVQLHRGKSPGQGRVIYPGEAKGYRRFPVSQGLESLRELVEEIRGTGEGIVLVGRVGVTSHFGDVLRRAEIPSRLESDDMK